ncbi:hypothetical protein WMY93_001218 [Mugilogobius chulae]|uniref:Rab-like protein 5 n=1 Tax=Mugilogobius chulae TaxID=88201 RepID=A0AAW0QCB8_9GOBI
MQVKILFIGPTESGKTVLANFLSDISENVGGEYRPTVGVRILKFDSHLEGGSDNRGCKVELWDCSGDFKFESCWPTLMKDCNGVVIVFNPDVQENQCLLIAHNKPESAVKEGHLSLASPLNRLPLIQSNLEEEPEVVRKAFVRYIGNVVKAMSESREREEMSIIM